MYLKVFYNIACLPFRDITKCHNGNIVLFIPTKFI